MADDVKIVKESAGKILSPYQSQIDDVGVTYELMRAGQKNVVTLLAGSTGADSIIGTDGNDIIVSNGVGKRGDGKPGIESIRGGKGIDMVVLPGNKADWTPLLPNVGDYPSNMAKDFWKENPQAYGRVSVMQHKDGSRVVMQDVEAVAFADGKLSFESGNPKRTAESGVQPLLLPAGVVELDRALKAGTVKSVTTAEALAQAEKAATPDQILSARLQSTDKASERIAAIPPIQRNPDLGITGAEIARELQSKAGTDFVNKVKAAPTLSPQ